MLVPTLPPNGSRFDPVAAECGFNPISFGQPLDQSARCHYREAPATSRDHIVPWVLGGDNSWWNLVTACATCNEAKDDTMSTCPCRFCTRSRQLYALGLHTQSKHRRSKRKADKRRRSQKRNQPKPLTFRIDEIIIKPE